MFSLKFSWIRSLKDKNNFHCWKEVADQLLSLVGGESVFHSNLILSPQYSCNVKKFGSFYKDLVYAWETLCNDRDINLNNKEMVLSQSLWNNSFILAANSKTLFNLSLFKKEVVFVNDLVDDSGNVKPWETLSEEKELNPTDFFGWYGILNAVLKEWKMSVKNCSMCERDQHVLQDTYCGFTVEKIFKHISCWKTEDIYDICVGKKLGNLHQKSFSLQNSMLQMKIGKNVYFSWKNNF